MKNIFLMVVFSTLFLLVGCEKEDLRPEILKKSGVIVLTKENPAKDFSYGYTFRGEPTYSYDPQTGENIACYGIAGLFTNQCFAIGQNIAGKIARTDSIYIIELVKVRY